jgi:peptidoglycan/LPS O-acetylase OafA/YrhL
MTAFFKRFPLYLAAIGVCYFAAWTASYLFMNGPDFRFYFGYLRLFWTGGGMERPALTGGVSIALTIPFSALAVWLIRRRLKRYGKTAEPPARADVAAAP